MEFLHGTFTMGQLLRQHFEIFERDGDEAARQWANSLSPEKQSQLSDEMLLYMEDAEHQERIADVRNFIESQVAIFGFTKN